MVSIGTVITILISLLVSVALPVILLILLARKYRKQGIVSAWLLGAAGFFVTQILIRLPILTVLQTQPWFLAFSQNHLFGYAFSLAFTAGLFELAGRFSVAKIMGRNLTLRRSLAAGLGHGGIEAIVIIGSAYVSNLAMIVMINTGTFDTLLAQAGGDAMILSQLEMLRSQLVDSTPGIFLLAGFERILAMICHLAMSLLVCYGIAHKKALPCVLVCLAIHTMIDLSAGIAMLIGTALTQTAAYIIIYTILTLTAVVSVLLIRKLCRLWLETEVSHDSEV